MTTSQRASTNDEASIRFVDLHPPADNFRQDVIDGLSKPQKTLSPKYFYDLRGSRLFDRICETPEYYVTRTELGLLDGIASDLSDRLGERVTVVEYGSGASVKVRKLLDSLQQPEGYVAIDISKEHLKASAHAIASDYPKLDVAAICADFVSPIDLPPELKLDIENPVGFFPGSTIGNLGPVGGVEFLKSAADFLSPDGQLVIGIDLKKDPEVLNAAYNDAGGVTSEFNLNILDRMRRELDAELDRSLFRHVAFYSEPKGRVEMHLEAVRDTSIRIGSEEFAFAQGETIHTENSYKFEMTQFGEMAANAGFGCDRVWTDEKEYFAIYLLETNEVASAA